MTTAPVRSAIESALGDRVVAEVPLSGGDVATSMRVELASGATVFAKSHPDPPPGFFSTEAESLRWLRSSGSVNVPRVLAHGDDPPHLVLEWIDSGPTRPGTEARFGAQLAELHRTAPGSFGRPDSRTTGSRRLPNDPAGSWAEFYATRRLVPLAGLAREAGALPTSTISSLMQVAESLEDLLGPPEPPSLLHGDLWAGNRLVDGEGDSWLIDPACFGGHREYDLSMMRLFGGFGAEVERSYDDSHPLAAGFEDRVPLHQLAPLVVHAIKFSGPYVAATGRAVEFCLGRLG